MNTLGSGEEEVDLAVIGSGPGGLSAAITAARYGMKAVVFDEQSAPGGQIFRRRPAGVAPTLPSYARGIGDVYADPATVSVDYRPGHCVWSFSEGNSLLIAGSGGTRCCRARQVILATGAGEWIVPVKGWTLPGVITAGGAQALMKGSAVSPGRRVAIAGIGPILLQLAAQLSAAGTEIVGLFEIDRFSDRMRAALKVAGHAGTAIQGLGLLSALATRGISVQGGWAVREILGETYVTGIRLGRVDGTAERRLEVDAVCLSYGLVPSVELAALRGCELVFDDAVGLWKVRRDTAMRTSVPSVFAVGDGADISGARAALLEGRIAGTEVAAAAGLVSRAESERHLRPVRRVLRRLRPVSSFLAQTFRVRLHLIDNIADDVVVCRCEDITAGTVRRAGQAGTRHTHELRTLYRAGMGDCQGRSCGVTIMRLLAAATGQDAADLGPPRPRAPIRPLSTREMSING